MLDTADLRARGMARKPADTPDGDSLSRSDILRVRLAKFVARTLPPELFRDVAVRRRLRAAIRDEVAALLGQPVTPSRYLDAPRTAPLRGAPVSR